MVASVSSRPARVGILAFLAAAVALAAGYLNNCFVGFGLSPGAGLAPAEMKDAKLDKATTVRVVVQGEHCRKDGDTATLACDVVCKQVTAGAAEVEATVGAQRTVDALKACLQARGVKVQVVSD
jgi:hypothetical protein